MNRGNGLISIRLTLRRWGCSLLLHAMWWGVAGWVWSQESAPPQRDVFQWDVALVPNLPLQAERSVSAQALRVARHVSRPVPSPAEDSAAAAAHESTAEESHARADPVEAMPAIEAHPSAASGESQTLPPDRAIEPEPIPSAAADALHQDANDRLSPLAESAVAVSSVSTAPVPPTDEAPARLAEEASLETGPSSPVFREDAAATVPGPVSDQVKPDFGWLMQTLWSRVLGLERCPYEASPVTPIHETFRQANALRRFRVSRTSPPLNAHAGHPQEGSFGRPAEYHRP